MRAPRCIHPGIVKSPFFIRTIALTGAQLCANSPDARYIRESDEGECMNEPDFYGVQSSSSTIEDWMIELLEDDRPAGPDVLLTMTDGLSWVYEASFVRHN